MDKINISLLSSDQARQLFREELQNYFSSNTILVESEEKKNQIVDLNGLIEARPFIGRRSTLYKKVSKGLIPHSKEGKKLYFNLSEIDNWLMSNNVRSLDELKEEYNKKRGGRI